MTNNKIEVNTVKPDISVTCGDDLVRLLDFSDELNLDSLVNDLEGYLSKTNGFGKTDEQKDTDYAIAQSKWKVYQEALREVKLNFYLDRTQYNLLTDLLLKKLEYDVNTVFIAIELTDLLGGMSSSKFSDEKEVKSFKVTPTEITYIYHLIQTYKVKGLTKEAYTFSKILRRIGEISKIVSYYDTHAKKLTEQISKWAYSLDGIIEMDQELIGGQEFQSNIEQ
jgi:hypothetical protein